MLGVVPDMYITLVLTTLASTTLGLFISSIAGNESRVAYLVMIVLFLQIIFAGTLFELPKAAEPIAWSTLSHWSLEALGSVVDIPRLVERTPGYTVRVEYRHTAGHLLSRWAALVVSGALFGGLTAVRLYTAERRK